MGLGAVCSVAPSLRADWGGLLQRSGFIEGRREEMQEGAPVLSAAAPGSKLERENQGASLRSPGRCSGLGPQGDAIRGGVPGGHCQESGRRERREGL